MSLCDIPAGPTDIICCYVGSPIIATLCKTTHWTTRFHNKRVSDCRLVQLDTRAIVPIKTMLVSLLKKYKWDELRDIRKFLVGRTWRGSCCAHHTIAALAYSKSRSYIHTRRFSKIVFRVRCMDQIWEVHFVSGIAQPMFAISCFLRQPQYITELYRMEELLFVMHKNGRVFATRAFDCAPHEVRRFIREITGDCAERVLFDRAIESRRCQRCNRFSRRPAVTFKNNCGNPGLGSVCFEMYKRSGMHLIIQRRAHKDLTQFSELK